VRGFCCERPKLCLAILAEGIGFSPVATRGAAGHAERPLRFLRIFCLPNKRYGVLVGQVPELLKERLLEMRLARELRQKEMADRLGLPLNTYRSYEKGKRTPVKLALIELNRRMAQLQINP
jgi:DNA-binding XRE family transcriptional regulator